MNDERLRELEDKIFLPDKPFDISDKLEHEEKKKEEHIRRINMVESLTRYSTHPAFDIGLVPESCLAYNSRAELPTPYKKHEEEITKAMAEKYEKIMEERAKDEGKPNEEDFP